jgi:hypothetical protein
MMQALEGQGCHCMSIKETCWKMVVTEVYWRSCRDVLLLTIADLQKTPKEMENVEQAQHNLKGNMDYLKIVEVNALEPCNILQLSLKEQILERVEEVNALMEQIDAKLGDVADGDAKVGDPVGFVLKVLNMQLILTELTCEVGPGGSHAPEYRCRV